MPSGQAKHSLKINPLTKKFKKEFGSLVTQFQPKSRIRTRNQIRIPAKIESPSVGRRVFVSCLRVPSIDCRYQLISRF